MNNTLNSRVKRLIKEDLLEYAKIISIVFGSGMLIGTIILSLLFSITGDNSIILEFSFGIINLTGFAVFMFIAGIVGGAELPAYVRYGIARGEYFTATIIGAIIVSILLLPLLLLIDQIISSILGLENIISTVRNGDLLTLAMYVLTFIVVYLAGFFIAMIFGRFGWVIGVMMTIILLITLGGIGWSSGLVVRISDMLLFMDNGYTSITQLIAPELLGPILVTIAVILASGIYTLVRDAPVKVR